MPNAPQIGLGGKRGGGCQLIREKRGRGRVKNYPEGRRRLHSLDILPTPVVTYAPHTSTIFSSSVIHATIYIVQRTMHLSIIVSKMLLVGLAGAVRCYYNRVYT